MRVQSTVKTVDGASPVPRQGFRTALKGQALRTSSASSQRRAAIRLAGMLLIEQNDEWLVSRRYLSEEPLAPVLDDIPAPPAEEVIPACRTVRCYRLSDVA